MSSSFRFICKPVSHMPGVAYDWTWTRETESGKVIAPKTFASLHEAVIDATRHGFREEDLPKGWSVRDLIETPFTTRPPRE